ncbi:MAG: hypothetical protein ACOYMR_01005 [Ilumatobacteraceae bacterium]
MEDDFKLIQMAARGPFSWGYLLQDYNDHLMPGQFALVWLLQHVAPMSFTLVAVCLAVLSSVSAWLMWLLLRDLVGERWLVVASLVVFAFAPLAVSAYLWYAAALQAVPLQIAALGMLRWHVRYVRTRRQTDAAVAVAFFVAGVLMWEKALVLFPLVLLFSLLWLGDRRGLRAAVRSVWRDRWQYLAYGIVAAAEVALLVWRVRPDPVPPAATDGYWVVFRETLLNGVVPYLFGGPFRQASAHYAGGAVVSWNWLYLAGGIAVVAASLRWYRDSWKAWVWLGSYWFVVCAVLTRSRYGTWFALVGRSPRYFPELTMLTCIAVTMAFATAKDPIRSRSMAAGGRAVGVTAVVVGVVFVAASLFTSRSMVDGHPGRRTERFVENVSSDLDRSGATVLLDATTPPSVLGLLGVGENRLSTLLAGMDRPPRFDVPTEHLYVAGADGHLAPIELKTAVSLPAESGSCVAEVRSGTPADVDLRADLFQWQWIIRLDVSTEAPALLEVTSGGVRQNLPLGVGSSTWYLVADDAFDSLGLTSFGDDAPICVSAVTIGVPAD